MKALLALVLLASLTACTQQGSEGLDISTKGDTGGDNGGWDNGGWDNGTDNSGPGASPSPSSSVGANPSPSPNTHLIDGTPAEQVAAINESLRFEKSKLDGVSAECKRVKKLAADNNKKDKADLRQECTTLSQEECNRRRKLLRDDYKQEKKDNKAACDAAKAPMKAEQKRLRRLRSEICQTDPTIPGCPQPYTPNPAYNGGTSNWTPEQRAMQQCEDEWNTRPNEKNFSNSCAIMRQVANMQDGDIAYATAEGTFVAYNCQGDRLANGKRTYEAMKRAFQADATHPPEFSAAMYRNWASVAHDRGHKVHELLNLISACNAYELVEPQDYHTTQGTGLTGALMDEGNLGGTKYCRFDYQSNNKFYMQTGKFHTETQQALEQCPEGFAPTRGAP